MYLHLPRDLNLHILLHFNVPLSSCLLIILSIQLLMCLLACHPSLYPSLSSCHSMIEFLHLQFAHDKTTSF